MRAPKVWVHALIIFLLGFGLRIWNMAMEPPGFEEMAATLVVSRGFANYLSAVPPDYDFCPPLYFLGLRPFAWLGLELFRLRLFSALAGAAIGVVVVLAGRKHLGGRTATLAAYLLAVHPLHVYYSQEVQPAALFTLISVVAFHYLLRSSQTNRTRHWLLFDICAVGLIYTMRGSIYLMSMFLTVHLARAIFFPLTTDQRRLRRSRLLQAVGYNYGAIAIAALPWMIIMPKGVQWVVPNPDLVDLLQIPLVHWITGKAAWPGLGNLVFPILALVLLAPPVFKVSRSATFPGFAVAVCAIGAALLPFAVSLTDKPRFDAPREALVALPFLAIGVGALVARCNLYVRAGLIAFFGSLFITATVKQAQSSEKPPFREMLQTLSKRTKTSDVVAFWPSYATTMGEYSNTVYGTNYEVTSANDLLTRWAELPPNRSINFVITQFPDKSPLLYTFRGALRQFAQSEVIWEDPSSYNAVIRTRNLDRHALKSWFLEPRSLEIVDGPTSDTFFLFTPGHKVFGGPQFHQEQLDASYDRAGRRVVWTTEPKVELQLPVTLQPGNYVLRLHASPVFDPPIALMAAGRRPEESRSVELTLRAFEQRRLRLDQEETLSINFSTDVELRTVPVHIEVSPMVRLNQPERLNFGLKIYSIAIDQAP